MTDALAVAAVLYVTGLVFTLFGCIMEYHITPSGWPEDKQKWAREIMRAPLWPKTLWGMFNRWIAQVALDAYRSK